MIPGKAGVTPPSASESEGRRSRGISDRVKDFVPRGYWESEVVNGGSGLKRSSSVIKPGAFYAAVSAIAVWGIKK